jgi:hypothetical protein
MADRGLWLTRQQAQAGGRCSQVPRSRRAAYGLLVKSP